VNRAEEDESEEEAASEIIKQLAQKTYEQHWARSKFRIMAEPGEKWTQLISRDNDPHQNNEFMPA